MLRYEYSYIYIYVYVLLGHYNPIWYGVSKEVGREGHMKTVKIFSGTQKKNIVHL